jgi:segregation and condensation protein B
MSDTPEDPREAPDNVIPLPRFGQPRVVAAPPADGPLGPPDATSLEAAVEALLFAADGPLNEDQLDRYLQHPGVAAVRGAILAVRDRYRRNGGGVRLEPIARGWQFRTDARFAPWVSAMRGARPVRLSRAALETLSVIAYRQPVTRSEVDDLRGVDSSAVIRLLVERGLVASQGQREDAPGRPRLYGTTGAFLELFGLRDLSGLPVLRDLRQAAAEEDAPAPPALTLPVPPALPPDPDFGADDAPLGDEPEDSSPGR